VRQPWAKLFADLSASQQIKKLKEILADLGMKGRTSMEQAKAIREKRELAQELGGVFAFSSLIDVKLTACGRGRSRI
jgi:ribosomal protein S2